MGQPTPSSMQRASEQLAPEQLVPKQLVPKQLAPKQLAPKQKAPKINVFAVVVLSYILVILFSAPYLSQHLILPEQTTVANKSAAIPDFAAITSIRERKSVFFAYFTPLVAMENLRLLQQRQQLIKLRRYLMAKHTPSIYQKTLITQLAHRFKVEMGSKHLLDITNALLNRVDAIPVSMVLAQAAIESAWGTSRFARQGNNYFGLWCFSKGCGLIPQRRHNGFNHEVRSFDTVPKGISAYFHNINTHKAYVKLRSLRALMRQSQQALDGEILVAGLEHNSERGQIYVEELRAIIHSNGLGQGN